MEQSRKWILSWSWSGRKFESQKLSQFLSQKLSPPASHYPKVGNDPREGNDHTIQERETNEVGVSGLNIRYFLKVSGQRSERRSEAKLVHSLKKWRFRAGLSDFFGQSCQKLIMFWRFSAHVQKTDCFLDSANVHTFSLFAHLVPRLSRNSGCSTQRLSRNNGCHTFG